MKSITLSPIADVLADVRAGRMVIIVDHADRENEGDLAVATELITPETVAFMMREARGLICVSVPPAIAERINLPLQVINNNSPFNTQFAVSIDHKSVASRGVTAEARALTMRRLIDPDVTEGEFVSPGHVFPLVANPSGVVRRHGQTEGSYDLARLVGLKPSGVICEILNPDGTMTRGAELNEFAKRHNLKITSIEEILRYRVSHEVLVRESTRALLEAEWGQFETVVFEDEVAQKEHLALIFGGRERLARTKAPLIRIHSECLTGDVFGSRRCDCGAQLDTSARQIVAAGVGAIIYLRQEGRGIGLGNKLRAYELQDDGHDTVEANLRLGFEADQRDFAVAAKILTSLGVDGVRLLTNNPKKVDALSQFGVQVVERLPVVIPADDYSRGYLEAKRDKLGHLL